jgi:hypothetical protein
LNYLQSARSPRRWLPAVIITLMVNAWLIWALWHGNVFPFPRPVELIRVRIYPMHPAVKAQPDVDHHGRATPAPPAARN